MDDQDFEWPENTGSPEVLSTSDPNVFFTRVEDGFIRNHPRHTDVIRFYRERWARVTWERDGVEFQGPLLRDDIKHLIKLLEGLL